MNEAPYIAEPLRAKLLRLIVELREAEWHDEPIERIVALDYEMRMAQYRLATGETHDVNF